jgi:alpha-N-acetylglucosaminidase
MLLVSALLIAASLSVATASPEQAAADLTRRVLGDRATEFRFASIPAENGMDVFEVEAKDGVATVGGSTGVAMASGLNWYLKYGCNAHVSWLGDQLALPKPLPDFAKVRRVSPYKHRYCFNYCTFSYTMAWWDWPRWEREIDWMAMNGINLPLSVTGQEAVWQGVYRGLGLADSDLESFFVGPAYLPFGWMGCIDGWAGPLPQTWIDERRGLEQKIVARERDLGMRPVLQGFTGHVAPAVMKKFPDARVRPLPKWCEFPPTYVLDPEDPLFARIARAFIDEQTRLYGTDHYYASDTFIEMSPPSDDPAYLTGLAKAIYGGMASADPDAVWVMQGWIFFNNPTFWKPPQAQAFLTAPPDDRMLLLDLFCDTKPTWDQTERFYGKPWVWCMLHNFGGVPGLFGDLKSLAQEPSLTLARPDRGRLEGIGITMEAIEQNPVVYELMLESAWRSEPHDARAWVHQYARRRYGAEAEPAQQAWDILLDTVYAAKSPSSFVFWRRPALDPKSVVRKPKEVGEALGLLLSCADQLGGQATYRHDLADVAVQWLGDLNTLQLEKVAQAYKAKDKAAFAAECDVFLQMLRDMDALQATRRETTLGKWIDDAVRWARNDEQRRHYEWNARNQVTLWGPADSILHDYARKNWAGLISTFYVPRWEKFFARLDETWSATFDAAGFEQEIRAWEDEWTHTTGLPPTPAGDTIEVARSLYEKYK